MQKSSVLSDHLNYNKRKIYFEVFARRHQKLPAYPCFKGIVCNIHVDIVWKWLDQHVTLSLVTLPVKSIMSLFFLFAISSRERWETPDVMSESQWMWLNMSWIELPMQYLVREHFFLQWCLLAPMTLQRYQTTSFVFVVLFDRSPAAETTHCVFKQYDGKLEIASCFGGKQPNPVSISYEGLQPALTYLRLHLPPHSFRVMHTHTHTHTPAESRM